MARRADWDTDDGFEVLNRTYPIENFEFIENDTFEIVPCKNESLSLINTKPIQYVTVIDQPIDIDVKTSLENSSKLPTNQNYTPIRYGSAAIIPYNEGFDLKSIVNRNSISPDKSSNDLMAILQNDKTTKQSFTDNHLQQIINDNNYERQSLVHIAKQAQQDFINAIHLD
ncbi:unnamed protein product [Adineta steineri]|uniref:Uncharacterized protein n=1 Tax=Adineta steineri TaxID=433720 RepID=A0A818YS93_9BILA|nr:unnamed protein product [Adineta steineri]CAF3759567.1 unnamed protein product [Adineta steineri]